MLKTPEIIRSGPCSRPKLSCNAWWNGGGGVVHTKFWNAKIQIEERTVDNDVKYVLPKVRV
jgi:hypothetical protein